MTPDRQPRGRPARDPARTSVVVVTSLTEAVLDPSAVHRDVEHPEAGGIGLFSGLVRNHHDGDRVDHLEYESWPERARIVLDQVARAVAAAHPSVRAVSVAHRVGRLEVGEISVLCAASAPHRDEALAAAAQLIDQIKARAPIWKRESLTDGRVHWPGSEP